MYNRRGNTSVSGTASVGGASGNSGSDSNGSSGPIDGGSTLGSRDKSAKGSQGRKEITVQLICFGSILLLLFQLLLNVALLPNLSASLGRIKPRESYDGISSRSPLPVSSSQAASIVSDGQVSTRFKPINVGDYEKMYPMGHFKGKYFNGADLADESMANDHRKWAKQRAVAQRSYKRLRFVAEGGKNGKATLLEKRVRKKAGQKDRAGAKAFPPTPTNVNEFYAEFNGIFDFHDGQYRLVTSTTGAARVFVDGVLVFDDWRPRTSPISKSQLVYLQSGNHAIRVEFRHFSTVHSFDHLTNFKGGDKALADAGKEGWQKTAAGLEVPMLAFKMKRDDFGLKVFVYDLPPSYNADIVKEYPKCRTHMFAPEVFIHEMMLKSPIRTKDPREADLFYVPTYTSCKYLGRGMFGVDPWFGKRLVHSAVEWISRKYPYWNRHKGQDHIFAMTYDYGACFEYKYDKANSAGVIREIHSSILLSIISDTTNACFRPSTDVVVPAMVSREDMLKPLLGAPQPLAAEKDIFLNDPDASADLPPPAPKKRDIFVYFQGSVDWGIDRDPDYSRGVRHAIKEKHGDDPLFLIGEGKSKEYVQLMSRALFCLCPLGFAVWSPRIYESVITGCIPVIIGDGIRLPFDWEMDWRDFSIKIPEWRIKKGQLRQILASIPVERIKMKQAALAKVRKSVAYLSTGTGDPRAPDAFGYLARELRAKAHTPQLVAHPSDNDFWT